MDIERLCKILSLSQSDSDGEALNAIRMANAILKKNGTTWSQLFTARNSGSTQANSYRSSYYSQSDADDFRETMRRNREAQEKRREQQAAHDNIHKVMRERMVEMFRVVRAHVRGSASADFIDSLYEQWQERGTLTPKQRVALEKFYRNCKK